MIDEIKKDAESRMKKSVESLRHDLSKLRTGRAHASLLDHITVECYGTEMPINQVANVAVSDARTLTVTPYDKSTVPAIEKAIMNAEMGLNPVTAGQTIRVPLPSLTEERRKEMIKVVRQEGEGARVAIRNVRRDANGDLKKAVKDKEISEDEQHRGEEEVQKLTDKYISQVDELVEQKEKDLMEF